MATKRKYLFLYLTLACFLSLIAIFTFDGYMGTYDTLYITAGEQEQKIEADYWLRQDRFWSTSVDWGETAFFRYEVDNRQFSGYTDNIDASVWRNQEKVRDLISQPISLAAFDKGQLEWVLDTSELLPEDAPPEQRFQYTILIKRGEIERRIILYTNPVSYVPKPPIPIPTR